MFGHFFGKKNNPPHLLGCESLTVRRNLGVGGKNSEAQVIIADRLGLMVLLDHELGEVFGRSAA